MTLVSFITDFADEAVILPVAAAVAMVMALAAWWRGAIAWSCAVGGTLATMAVLKAGYAACGVILPFAGVHSPSGHTAAAAAVYGGVLAIVAERATGHRRYAVPCAIGVAVVIGVSRLVLGVHSLSEVVIGGLVGSCGASALAWWGGLPPREVRLVRLVFAALLMMALFHGLHLGIEHRLRTMSVWPFTLCSRLSHLQLGAIGL